MKTCNQLSELLGELSKPEASGKAEYWMSRSWDPPYWIIDPMAAIASFGESALEPLFELIQNTGQYFVKYRAACTIHLIGVEGRQIHYRIDEIRREEFKIAKAREKLLLLLQISELVDTVLELMVRDPWSIDIPVIIECLKNSLHGTRLVKALQNYQIPDRPVHQILPERIGSIYCSVELGNKNYLQNLVNALQLTLGNIIDIEKPIVDEELKNGSFGPGGQYCGTINQVLHNFTRSYSRWEGHKVDYYCENGRIIFCTIETARKRWLDWFVTQRSQRTE